jgi:hypothetical protein
VLVPGGRCFASFFLLNEGSLALLRSRRSSIDFEHDFGGYRAKSKKKPEDAIAYLEDSVRNLYADRGLEISELVYYRSWLQVLARPERFLELSGRYGSREMKPSISCSGFFRAPVLYTAVAIVTK